MVWGHCSHGASFSMFLWGGELATTYTVIFLESYFAGIPVIVRSLIIEIKLKFQNTSSGILIVET
jgi:hypothetical protein